MVNIKKFNEEWQSKIDSLFLQEISDRLYGPDSESYIKAIEDLNKTHRKRVGRVGSELYDDSLEQKRKQRERDIISQFK